jgi:hypothetical protein
MGRWGAGWLAESEQGRALKALVAQSTPFWQVWYFGSRPCTQPPGTGNLAGNKSSI